MTPEVLAERLDSLSQDRAAAGDGRGDLRGLPAEPRLPRRARLRRPDPAGAAGAASSTRTTSSGCATAGPTSWRMRRRTRAGCRRRSCGCWPGPGGNWVRVGDPNQAIFETFTTASPRYLRDFLSEEGVTARELPNSGRSTLQHHRSGELAGRVERARASGRRSCAMRLRRTLHRADAAGDPQPNPPDDPQAVRLPAGKFTPAEELEAVVSARSLAAGAPGRDRRRAGAEQRARVRRGGGAEGARASSRSSCCGARARRARWPARWATSWPAWPTRPTRASWPPPTGSGGARDREDADAAAASEQPQQGHRAVPQRRGVPVAAARVRGPERDRTAGRRTRCMRSSCALPDRRAALAGGGHAAHRPAPAHDRAGPVRQAGRSGPDAQAGGRAAQAAAEHPAWRLPELIEELATIARNERKFLGFSDDDTGFDPDAHRGKVRGDHAQGEGAGVGPGLPDVGQRLRLPVRAARRLVHLGEVVHPRSAQPAGRGAGAAGGLAVEARAAAARAQPTEAARIEYAAERLRLLYVGITRARRELIITCEHGPQRQGGARGPR